MKSNSTWERAILVRLLAELVWLGLVVVVGQGQWFETSTRQRSANYKEKKYNLSYSAQPEHSKYVA